MCIILQRREGKPITKAHLHARVNSALGNIGMVFGRLFALPLVSSVAPT
jgi:hypothetical protein